MLSADLLRAAKSVEYTERRQGEIVFKLKASRLRETRGGKSLLEGIEGYDLNPDGTIRNQIRSREAEYDRDSKRAFFVGDVRIQMGQTIHLRTSSLHYDLAAGVGSTEDLVELDSPEMKGTAKGIRYDAIRKELELKGAVDFSITRVVMEKNGSARTEAYRVTSERGYYQGSTQTARFEGGTRLESVNGSLSGDSVVARLSADGKHLTGLLCEGGAVYESKAAGQARTLQGDRMVFELAESGDIRNVDVQGAARLFQDSTEGRQELTGESIHLELDPLAGVPTFLNCQGQARFRLTREAQTTVLQGDKIESRFFAGTNNLDQVTAYNGAKAAFTASAGASNQLEAQLLRLFFRTSEGVNTLKELVAEHSVLWRFESAAPGTAGEPSSTRSLSADWLRLEYSSADNTPDSANASVDVILTASDSNQEVPGNVRRLRCDQAYFGFYPGGKFLKILDGSGHVETYNFLPADVARSAPAQEMRTWSTNISSRFRAADGAVDSVAQWGDLRYADGVRQAQAARLDYSAATQILVLSGAPTVTDADGSTSGDSMEYHLSQKLLKVLGRVRSVLNAGSAGTNSLFTESSDASEPTIVTSDRLDYRTDESRVTYSGRVQLLSETSQLQAKTLTVINSGVGIDAAGEVKHLIFSTNGQPGSKASKRPENGDPTVVRSASLHFTKVKHSILYDGGVVLQSKDVQLSARQVEVFLDSDARRIERAEASGKIRIVQAGREAQGDAAEYYLDPGKFVLTGNMATILDPARGQSWARRLTFFISDDRIQLENR
jgi:LPS export ABC transporter protein LptC